MKVSKWTKERCVEEARKYKTRSEFQKGASQAFHISKENGWIDEMSWFPTVEDRKPNGYWRNKDNFLREARKYSSKKEMERGNLGAYAAGLKYHYFSDVTWFNEKKKLPYGYWKDKGHCIEEARKYSSKKEFQENNSSAYYSSLKYDYLKEMTWFNNKDGNGKER